MARPLRLELAGALYHVTSRGDGREDIFLSDEDSIAWLEILADVCRRFNWVCHAYCQMTNHYHMVIETPDANLSKGMRQFNGVYTQRINRTHGRVGHVFQGRFKAILVDKDSYLLELARYVVLNPLRANMVPRLEQWPWSSFPATCGQTAKPDWLQVDFVLAQFRFSIQRARAIEKYVAFVHEGAKLPSVWEQLQGQVYLGSESFIKKMQALVDKKPTLTEIPRAQRAFDFTGTQLVECDCEIEQQLKCLKVHEGDPAKGKQRGRSRNAPKFDLRAQLFKMCGVDLTRIDGIDVTTAMAVISETGTDMSRFPTVGHFASWLGLCPGTKITGGKVMSGKTKRCANHAAQALRLAAAALRTSQSALGAYFRRMCSRMDKPKAVTAAAHKLARLIYTMLTKGEEYTDKGQEYYEERYRQRVMHHLAKRTEKLGMHLVPIPQAA